MVDSALLRPGRLDKLLYVPLPDPAGRASILDTLVRRVPLAGDVDVPSIGMSQHCEGFSGADLGALVRPLCASHSGRPSAQQLFQVLRVKLWPCCGVTFRWIPDRNFCLQGYTGEMVGTKPILLNSSSSVQMWTKSMITRLLAGRISWKLCVFV